MMHHPVSIPIIITFFSGVLTLGSFLLLALNQIIMGFVLEEYFEIKYDTKLFYNKKLPYSPMAIIGTKTKIISKYVDIYYRNSKKSDKDLIEKILSKENPFFYIKEFDIKSVNKFIIFISVIDKILFKIAIASLFITLPLLYLHDKNYF